MPIFEARVKIECSAETAFDFLIRPSNIIQISPPETGLHFDAAPEILEVGSQLEFKIQGYGQVQAITHEITALNRPGSYVEQQISGPLKAWIHEHLFESADSDSVEIIDKIEFEPPGGILGFMITADKIHESLEDGFYHRHQQLKKLLESAG